MGAALGMPLTGAGLAAGAPAAARAMERPRGTDRERAAAYLETLFLEAGVPAERLRRSARAAWPAARRAALWSGDRGRHPRGAGAAPRRRAPARAWCRTATAGWRRRSRRPGLRPLLRGGGRLGAGRGGEARSRYLPGRAGGAGRRAGRGALRRRPVRGGRGRRAGRRASPRSCSLPPGRRPAARAARPPARSARWPTTLLKERLAS